MGEIVNLGRERKRRARAGATQEAAENRLRHGRTGAQKENDRRARERREKALEGARREEKPEGG
jgi:hypothetical protein